MFDFMMTEEQKRLEDEVRDLVSWVPRQLILDMDAMIAPFPKMFLEECGRRNLLGLRFPEKYGGRGMGWQEEVIAIAEMGLLGVPLTCLYSLVSIVGECIEKFGNEDQKQRFLVPTLKGEMVCAEALTEPRGGSDFFGATCTACLEGDHYVLHGQKRFVVGAEGADYFMVYARTDPDVTPRDGLSCFLVERDSDVEVKTVYGLMGARGSGTGRVLFRDTRVPVQNLVGKENEASRIFYRMMVPERMTSAAGCVGGSREGLELAARYSTRRKAFGVQIKNFQAVSFMIAEGLIKLDAMKSLIYTTARAADAGIPHGRLRRMVSETKKFSTEVAWDIANLVMQAMGGIAYTNVYPVERLVRDSRLLSIWTGTNEIMSLIIQHEFYKELEAEVKGKRDMELDAPEAFNDEEKIYE
ncbi:MAG: acyl-CoA dehydrogenase family protein [Actinomycetota bacterium]|nr:acyl-CoA dehydrogenase family protein [Actinomycetota bacterium]